MHDSATHTPPPPEIQCEVVELLGSGTTGTVWRATLSAPLGEVPAGTDIAIKRLHAKAALTPELSAAFGRECEAALAVRSPGIVRGLAAGQDSTGSWLALRYVPGLTLRQQLDAHGALPEPQVRMVAERLVRALSDLHAAGYLHGDLKPDNVRFDGEGRAVLLDLGFVIPIPLESGPNRTSGSLPYLSPEELRGLRANGSSEVYSLGILLYEAASGSHPFASKSELSNADELPNALLTNTFEPPSLRVPTLSPFLDSLLEEMLSGQPTQRPGLVNLVEITASQESSSWWRDVQVSAGGAAHKTRRQSASNLPLVGRRQEMEALLAAAARLQPDASLDRDAGGGVLRLVGARGIGKSRLIREFARRVRAGEPAPLYLQGRCSSFQEARPCQPILTLLSRFLGLPGGAQPGEREQTLLATLLPSAERNALLGALDPGYAGATSASIPAALTAWLLALGQTGAVIIYVDDLQYADEGTLEILSRLTAELQRSPLLLILGSDPTEVARRPEAQRVLEERLTALPSSATIELGPLSKDALLDLTDALFSHAAPRRRLASVLWKRSRGNPGMLAELLRGLLKRGEALPTADGLELLIHPDELPLPESLREETARAYAQLDPHDRVWLARLAVSGGRIQTRFLLLAWPRERASDLDLTLARLTRGGWLRPDGDRFHFRRPAQRSAIYKRLPSERRRELHSAVARALLPGPGGKLSLADAFQRAYHLRCAGDFEGLLRILRPLLKRLLDRGQPARVHTLGLWGLEALSNLPKEKRTGSMAMEFLWAAADAADRLGYREKQRQLLEQIESFQKEGESDPQAQARVFLLYARYAISTGQHEKARGMLLQALQLLEPTNATELLCSILLSLASIDTHEGDLGLARRRARQVIERAQDPLILARGELALGAIDMLQGRIESSLRRADQCLILLRRSNRFETLAARARVHSLRARIYRGAGRPRRALVSAQRALRFATRAGDRRLEIEVQARLGVHMLDIDRVAEAESLLRDSLLVATEIEDRRSESISTLFLGILLGEQGDPSAAKVLARCARVSRRIGNVRTEAVCIAIQSRILFQTDPEHAIVHSQRAVDLLERAGAELIDRIVIRGTHAMILKAVGRTEDADLEIVRLRRRMRAAAGRIEAPLLQRRLRLATGQLLRAALSPEGPVYRRVHLDQI